MSDPQNANTKCFSGILNLLLCKGSLPTHPSDQIITESDTTKFSDVLKKAPETESKQEVSATGPGIVARLMGLETLPDLDWVPKARLADSYARSRSVNSMDYLIEFNPPSSHQHHRRVRTSVSFREVPTVLSQQNHEYFVFYLGNVDETTELGSKLRESEVGVAELNQKKTERSSSNNNKEEKKNREKVVVKTKENVEKKMKKSSKGKDEPRRVYGRHCSKVGDCHEVYKRPRAMPPKAKNSSSKKTDQQKAAPIVGLKFTEKKKKIQPIKEAQSKHESNKSSRTAVSVLDIQDILIHHECSLSEVSNAVVDLNSRRKSSSKTSNFECPSPHITRVWNGDCLNVGAIKKKDKKTLKITGGETEYCHVQLLGEICKLTQADLKEPYWVAGERFKFEDFEEVCVESGEQILDELLHQMVDDLISGVSHVV